MTEFALIETRTINNAVVDGYYHSKEAWFTRTQIGSALGYADPQNAITIIHRKHRNRLDPLSRWCQIDTPSGVQEGFVYSFRGVLEICRWSRQPKADMVMDALYDMAESVRDKGYYSCMSDEDLIQLLASKCIDNPSLEERLTNKHLIPDMKKILLRDEKETMGVIVREYQRKSRGLISWYSKHPSDEFHVEAERITNEAIAALEEQCPHFKEQGMKKMGIPVTTKKES